MRKNSKIILPLLCAVMTVSSIPSIHAVTAPEVIESLTYDDSVDYMNLMIQCAKTNTPESLRQGAVYEAQRNMKVIESQNDDHEITHLFTTHTDGQSILGSIKQSREEKIAENYKKCYTEADVDMLAKTMFCEARGLKSKTEIACVGWTILNRVDNSQFPNTIKAVVTAKNQFAYRANAGTVSSYGYDLKELARDILDRWSMEKAGLTDVGRILPARFMYFTGNGIGNTFRTGHKCGEVWNYSYATPYNC